MKPRLLDLFCGAGGAGMGYSRAGWDVVGVDIAPQPNYPFEFVQMDALTFLRDGCWKWHEFYYPTPFTAIHASPPCQHFTKYRNVVKDITERYEDFLAPTRELLKQTGLPYVIENVEGSPLHNPLTLCGTMFDETLDIRRHRLFETNWDLTPPLWPCRHKLQGPNRYRGGAWKRMSEKNPEIRPNSPIRNSMEIGTWSIPLEKQKAAMGVNWTVTVRELSEAIPPAYTEYIGGELMKALGVELAA